MLNLHTAHPYQLALAGLLTVVCSGCGEVSPLPETPANASPAGARPDDRPLGDDERIVPPCTRGSLTWHANGSLVGSWTADGDTSQRKEGTLPELVETFSTFPKMKLLWIYLIDDGLTTEQYRQIARLHSLEMIVIKQYGAISGPTLAPLTEMPHLTALEIIEARVDAEVVKTLARSPSLRDVYVGSGYSLTEAVKRYGARFRIIRTNNYEP